MASIDTGLIKQFVKITNDSQPKKVDSTFHATVLRKDNDDDNQVYVKIDGGIDETVAFMSTDVLEGDRVLITIENHSARIVSNLTSPASGRGATDLDIQINGSPLYWDDEPIMVTEPNEYPVIVNDIQLTDDSDPPNLLFWDADEYYDEETDDYAFPEPVTEQTDYSILNSYHYDSELDIWVPVGDATYSSSIVSELDEKITEGQLAQTIDNMQLISESDLSENLSVVNNTLNSHNSRLERIETFEDNYEGYIETISGRLQVDNGIRVGKENESNVFISDSAIQFREGQVPQASLSNNILNINETDISKIRLGRFVLEVMGDDSLALKVREGV